MVSWVGRNDLSEKRTFNSIARFRYLRTKEKEDSKFSALKVGLNLYSCERFKF